jgi:hypothetical protein
MKSNRKATYELSVAIVRPWNCYLRISAKSVRTLSPFSVVTVLIVTLVASVSTPVSLSVSIKVEMCATDVSLASSSLLVLTLRVFLARASRMMFFHSSGPRDLPLNLVPSLIDGSRIDACLCLAALTGISN